MKLFKQKLGLSSKTSEIPKLGIRENLAQFSLLVLVNALVGAMVGLERTILPEMAEKDFGLAAKSAILSFIVVFGLSKAFMNYFAGRLSDHWGRKAVLIAGWLVMVPVPFMLMWAPSWNWILIANIFLGIGQGLAWSMTVIMKIDLAGPQKRGLAMGLNEFAGYFAVAGSALATGYLAAHFGLRPDPFYLGIVYVIMGLVLSVALVRETQLHVHHESKLHESNLQGTISQKEIFLKTSFVDRNLSSITQAGFVNNLNDGMAWGLFPVIFTTFGMNLKQVGWLAAIYPATWGIFQLWTGHLSDKVGRKWLIASGMWVQAIGIAVTAISNNFWEFAIGSVLLGLGTAMVYPTLLAGIGDVAHPHWRASAVGIYRLWRDLGYAAGAIVAGITTDLLGLIPATWLVMFITLLSGVIVAVRMKETMRLKLNEVIDTSCVKAKTAFQLLQEEIVVIVDVRSETEYAEGHIIGALHLPLEHLPQSVNSLPKDGRIITVCNKGGGRSEKAAELLRNLGWNNSRWLCGGYLQWVHTGLPHYGK